MKILFLSLKNYDGLNIYGRSYEYTNFYLKLKAVYKNVDFLGIDEEIWKYGKLNLNKKIISLSDSYDVFFFFMYKDEFYKETLRYLKNKKKLKTICWFSDDDWRYEIYSKKFIGKFNLLITTYKSAFQKFKRDGENNILLSQWFADPLDNLNVNKKYKYNVSFVGKKYGSRSRYINFLKKKNIDIKVFGKGWRNSSYFEGDVHQIYNFSKINLNFSDSSTGFSIKNFFKVFFNKDILQKYRLNKIQKLPIFFKNLILLKSKQIKARPFEILSSKNFLLCEHVNGLEDYFDIGKDIDTFHNESELFEKINYYLQNERLREKIAVNGYSKIVLEHNFKNRFDKIFSFLDMN